MSKTITLQGRRVELVERAIEPPKHGAVAAQAGRDAAGVLYFKGRRGGWARAYQTRGRAEQMLCAASKVEGGAK